MRSDEGKGGKADYGLKSNLSRAKSKIGSRKDDLAGRMKGREMPYTQSTQSGSFDQGRGMRAKMWGTEPNMTRRGGMPYEMNGPERRTTGARKESKA